MTAERGYARGEPVPFDTSVAHVARVYDYWLGGKDNFAADRELAQKMLAVHPVSAQMAQENRQFLGRTVRYVAARGVRQFIDVGAGLPTALNTHDIARQVNPEARVAYVDNDPIVISHARSLLATDADDPYQIVATLLDAVPPGSYLGISHPASDIEAEKMAQMAERLNRMMAEKVSFRDRAGVARFFDGLELVEPGLVRAQLWRPDSELTAASPAALWGGVARKR